MIESSVHGILMTDDNVKRDLANILDIDFDTMTLMHEDAYINGMYADFSVLSGNKIRAIIECKGSNLSVTDYVRGIGQLYQYEYYFDKRVPHKSYEYHDNFNVVYFFPSSVVVTSAFNIGKFKYPTTALLIEINEKRNIIRKITSKELSTFESTLDKNLISISQYYIRDNRFYELYLLLQYLLYLKVIGRNSCNRSTIEANFLTKLETPNNGNWRNAFISLSSLGLIDGKNMLTTAGVTVAITDFSEFLYFIYDSYIKPYVQELFDVFGDNQEITISNSDIVSFIRTKNNGKDVLFLTESEGRYISSWMNILRDDFGCIEFSSRNNLRKINYNPLLFNKEALCDKIQEHSKAFSYIDKYFDVLFAYQIKEVEE